MRKSELFKIQKKYIDLLKWFEYNGYVISSSLRSSNYYEEGHNKGQLLVYPSIQINRGKDYTEGGVITLEDQTKYEFSVDFNFVVQGSLHTMYKWHRFIKRLRDKEEKFPKVFKDCYFDTFYNDNRIKISSSMHDFQKDDFQEENVEYYIPIEVSYIFKTMTLSEEAYK